MNPFEYEDFPLHFNRNVLESPNSSKVSISKMPKSSEIAKNVCVQNLICYAYCRKSPPALEKKIGIKEHKCIT